MAPRASSSGGKRRHGRAARRVETPATRSATSAARRAMSARSLRSMSVGCGRGPLRAGAGLRGGLRSAADRRARCRAGRERRFGDARVRRRCARAACGHGPDMRRGGWSHHADQQRGRARGRSSPTSSSRALAQPKRSSRGEWWPTIASIVLTRAVSTGAPGAPATAAHTLGATTASTLFSATTRSPRPPSPRRRRHGSRPDEARHRLRAAHRDRRPQRAPFRAPAPRPPAQLAGRRR